MRPGQLHSRFQGTLFLTALVLLCTGAPLTAQFTSAIEGRVTDPSEAGVPKAVVTVENQATGVKRVVETSEVGYYRVASLPPGNFITAFYGIVDISERRMVYANAGHPPPLIVRATGAIEALAVTGPALGFPHVAPMREGYAVFHPGDGLVLFTDGVTDVGPSPDEFFDVAGVQATIRSLWPGDAVTIGNSLLDEVARRGGKELSDDATVVVVKFE